MIEPGVIEHRQGRFGRWLRERRVAVAVWIAVIEGLLLIVHAIPKLPMLAIAVLVVVGFFWLGHRLRPGVFRDVAWIAAVSQAFVMLIPILVIVVGTLALVAVGILAAFALVLLFTSRS